MSKTILYIASSLDGFIARNNGSVDWLDELPQDGQDYGYHDFYSTIDTVVMGRKTYEMVLSFGVAWPYGNCETIVVSTSTTLEISTPATRRIDRVDSDLIESFRTKAGKDIWLVGGGNLISTFLEKGAIDQIQLHLIPVILGDGIPLFPAPGPPAGFKIVRSQTFGDHSVMLCLDRKD